MRPALPHAMPRIARFSPALAFTLLPGRSTVPWAERTRLRMRRSSTTMTPWCLVRSVVLRCSQSSRRRPCLARSAAIWPRVRRCRLDIGAPGLCMSCWRAALCCNPKRRRVSPSVRRVGMSSMAPFDSAIVWTTPRSTPTGGPGLAETSTAGSSIRNKMCQPSESLMSLAPVIRPGQFRDIPGKGRVKRNRTRPMKGMVTSAQRRFIRVMFSAEPWGMSMAR